MQRKDTIALDQFDIRFSVPCGSEGQKVPGLRVFLT